MARSPPARVFDPFLADERPPLNDGINYGEANYFRTLGTGERALFR
jgi:hypothetical protein